jgi:hypothetical protein
MLESCLFESTVDLRHLKTSKIISLDNSKFNGTLWADGLQMERNFFIQNAEFSELSLGAAKIEGQVDMSGSTFAGKLNIKIACRWDRISSLGWGHVSSFL